MPRTILRACIALVGARELMRALVRFYYFLRARARAAGRGRRAGRRVRRSVGCLSAVSDDATTRARAWDDDDDDDDDAVPRATDPFADGAPRGIASRDSRVALRVTFKNCTKERVQLFWIGYDGRQRPYKIIDPGKTYEQPSFASHPWTFTTYVGVTSAYNKKKKQPLRCVTSSGVPLHVVTRGSDDTYDDWNDVYVTSREIRIYLPKVAQSWTTETHGEFHEAFRRAAKAFLLTHHRLEREDPTVGLGSIPTHLAVEIIRLASPRVAQYAPIRVAGGEDTHDEAMTATTTTTI